MSRVVVTGGSGFIGSHLVERLVERGDEITVLDPASPPEDQRPLDGRVRYVTEDVRDASALSSIITPDVDIVYHLSGVVGVDRYLDRPLDVIDVTIGGTRNVLDAASRVRAKVVVASTSEVYGKNQDIPWSEDTDRVLGATTADRWAYSSSKALAEHLTFAFIRERRLAATIVRYFNVYGPRQRPALVISRSIHRALRGLPPILYDGGKQTRCFTFVDDAVEGTIRAAVDPLADGHCFNIGSQLETPIIDAIELVVALTGVAQAIIPFDTADRLGTRYQDISRRVPDTTKAQRMLGWRCETSLRTGLTRTIDWARRNPWWQRIPAGDEM